MASLDVFGYGTHEVLNRAPAMVDYDAYAHDPALGKILRSTRLCCEDDRRGWEDGINWIRSPLCGGIEKSGNEDRLSSDIASADLSNLPLPDHRHRFETCQCSSGGSEPAEAEPRSDQTLDAPMILLDNIIRYLHCRRRERRQSSPSLFISAIALG